MKMDLDQIKYWISRFGEMFLSQSLIYAFDADNRANQDIGLRRFV
jgi:hypothetical protein